MTTPPPTCPMTSAPTTAYCACIRDMRYIRFLIRSDARSCLEQLESKGVTTYTYDTTFKDNWNSMCSGQYDDIWNQREQNDGQLRINRNSTMPADDSVESNPGPSIKPTSKVRKTRRTKKQPRR